MTSRARFLTLLAGGGLFCLLAAVLVLAWFLRPSLVDDLIFKVQRCVRREFIPDKPEFVGNHQGRRVHLLRQLPGDKAVAQDAVIGFEQPCLLAVAVEHKGQVFCDLKDIVLDGRPVPQDSVKPLEAGLPELERVVWIKLEPEKHHYSNSNDIPGWWGDIHYKENIWHSSRAPVEAEVDTLWLRGVSWQGEPVGAMRFKAALEFKDCFLSTPGAEAVQKGGRLPGVLRISRKGGSGHEAVDQALALANLPYIWGSASFRGAGAPKSHQSELFIGADCADMVVAAWRKAGLTSMSYSGAAPLVAKLKHRKRAFSIASLEAGFYLDTHGKRIPFSETGLAPGAGIFWVYGGGKGHAGLLLEDLGPDGEANGFLDTSDPVLHTSWSTPIIQELGSIMMHITPVLAVSL